MKKTPYRAMILTSLICTLIMGSLVYYSIGVVDRANYKSEASQRLNDICITLENNSRETSEVMEQVYEDYKSKTRVVAMMLSKTPEIMTDETQILSAFQTKAERYSSAPTFQRIRKAYAASFQEMWETESLPIFL